MSYYTLNYISFQTLLSHFSQNERNEGLVTKDKVTTFPEVKHNISCFTLVTYYCRKHPVKVTGALDIFDRGVKINMKIYACSRLAYTTDVNFLLTSLLLKHGDNSRLRQACVSTATFSVTLNTGMSCWRLQTQSCWLIFQ